MSIANGERRKSNVDAVAINYLLDVEFAKHNLRDRAPDDLRFYDALASIGIRKGIVAGKSNTVKFYASRGYNLSTKIDAFGLDQTLVEFTLATSNDRHSSKFKTKLSRLAKHLGEKIVVPSSQNAIFKIREISNKKEQWLDYVYTVDDYKCVIQQGEHVLTVSESINYDYVPPTSKMQQKESQSIIENTPFMQKIPIINSNVKKELLDLYPLNAKAAKVESILHLLASHELFSAVSKGDLNKVKFYIQNKYNSNLVYLIGSQEYDLIGRAEYLYQKARTIEVKANLENVINYLKKEYHPNVNDNVVIDILASNPEEGILKLNYSSMLGNHIMNLQKGSIFFDKF